MVFQQILLDVTNFNVFHYFSRFIKIVVYTAVGFTIPSDKYCESYLTHAHWSPTNNDDFTVDENLYLE